MGRGAGVVWAGQSRYPVPLPPLERQRRARGRSAVGQTADYLEAPARKETLPAQGAPPSGQEGDEVPRLGAIREEP